MKSECRHIESLLYLYRDGELSEQERSMVTAHTSGCPRCRHILEQLLSIETALAPGREVIPDVPADTPVVDRVLEEINASPAPLSIKTRWGLVYRPLLYWLRPALSVAVLAAVTILVAQQTRDALAVAELEKRLKVRGNAVTEEKPLPGEVDSWLQGQQQSFFYPAPNTAIAGDPLQLLGHGLMNLLRPHTGLLDELSRRYPDLSAVTLDDGIDERERRILNTEGRAFLKEFDQLIREGAKKP